MGELRRRLNFWTPILSVHNFKKMTMDDFDRTSSHCVLAWWDLNVHIGAFHKRKMTARPLKELERVLGHRLHVESWDRFDVLPEGVWKFEAFSYLDTADPALAAYTMLKKLSPLSDWLAMPWYNRAPAPYTDDVDEDTICSFYWHPPDQRGLPRYQSSGVLLRLADRHSTYFDRHDRYHRNARPIVRLSGALHPRCNFVVEFTIHIICGNKQQLMTYHWPRFQKSKWPKSVSDVDVDARTHAGKPNVIRVRQTLSNMCEHDAVAYCLSYAPGLRINLETGTEFQFNGMRRPTGDYSDGIVAFSMTRTLG